MDANMTAMRMRRPCARCGKLMGARRLYLDGQRRLIALCLACAREVGLAGPGGRRWAEEEAK
jgi:hypothetical protein